MSATSSSKNNYYHVVVEPTKSHHTTIGSHKAYHTKTEVEKREEEIEKRLYIVLGITALVSPLVFGVVSRLFKS